MTGLSIGSYLKEPATLPLSTILGMWGPVEFFAIGTQMYLAYQKQVANAETTVVATDTTTDEIDSSNSTDSSLNDSATPNDTSASES